MELLRLEEAGLVRQDDRLHPVAEVKLLQDMGDVRLDGRLADVELLPDLRVGEALCNQAQDVALAARQLVEPARLRGPRDAGELPDHNTVLGEELLFRGLLLPRVNGAFGNRDWIANGVLFACYHLHMPWVIPTALADTLILAYPTKRYRSAWIGIAVHSAQSVFVAAIILTLVL